MKKLLYPFAIIIVITIVITLAFGYFNFEISYLLQLLLGVAIVALSLAFLVERNVEKADQL
jgi:ABC-type transport system involved in cytochrome bd biosynthesis fused ATPase/permease subunit